MSAAPTPEQHRALLDDCWQIARALPTSGVLDRGRRPYRAIRFERKLESVRSDPAGLLTYIRGMARRTSEGLEALVLYDRLDLSVERRLILDRGKVYAALFSAEDRAAAEQKLGQWEAQVSNLARNNALADRAKREARETRFERIREQLPSDPNALRAIAATTVDPEEMVVVNRAILERSPGDVVGLNRLGRALESLGWDEAARSTFEQVLKGDPENAIAKKRLGRLNGGS